MRQSDQVTDNLAMPSYVLVTPVRNEENTIGRTIESVLKQTILPREWIIVNDGSTDSTEAIVQKACSENPWIKCVNLQPREKPSFAAVVQNTELGISQIATADYEFLGLLDSDVEFQKDYFEILIDEFRNNKRLGLAGGVAIDIGKPKNVLPRNRQDVPGALQFFRRDCFESLGGLIAIPEGGWDSITCAKARMNGYETKLVAKLIVDHLKPRNTIHGGTVRRIWQMGTRDYALGYHPLFEFAKCISKYRERPYFIYGFLWWLGYLSSSIQRKERRLPTDVSRYIRQEQLQRLGIGRLHRMEGVTMKTTSR